MGTTDREGYRENRRCSRDTFPESYITEYTTMRRYHRSTSSTRSSSTGPVATSPVDAQRHAPFEDADLCSGSETGSYLRLIDVCISQLQA